MMVAFYGRTYGKDAKIPPESFNLWEKRAVAALNRITDKDISENLDENAKMCICEVAEFLYENSKSDGILSENNDGYSVHFDKEGKNGRIYDIAERWLLKSGLLYRGDVLC